MGLDIRKPIGLLFAIIAAELLASEGIKVMRATGGTSNTNTWCAAAFGLFGLVLLWLSHGTRKAS